MGARSNQLGQGLALFAVLYGVQGTAAEAKRPRLAVLGLSSDPADPHELVNAAIAKGLREQGLEVAPQAVTPTQRPDCADATCFAQLANARGVDYLVCAALAAGEAAAPPTWTLTLTLLDRTGEPVSEIAKAVADRSPDSLVDAVEEELPKLVQPLREVTPEAARPTAAAKAIVATEPSHLPSYAFLVSGAVLLLGSGAVGYAADSANSALDNAVSGATSGNIPALRSSLSTEAWVSTGLTVGGVAAIVVGLVLFYAGESSGGPRTSASAAMPALAWGF